MTALVVVGMSIREAGERDVLQVPLARARHVSSSGKSREVCCPTRTGCLARSAETDPGPVAADGFAITVGSAG